MPAQLPFTCHSDVIITESQLAAQVKEANLDGPDLGLLSSLESSTRTDGRHMAETGRSEQVQLELNTPAGALTASVDVPTGFVPITSIVPLLRRLGEEAQALEVERSRAAGAEISCRRGCAACCRMLVPVSAPEAFALLDAVERQPQERKVQIEEKLRAAQDRLADAGLLPRLHAVAESTSPTTDEELDPLNREYYALRLACPFLEEESCSIYEDRPAACRELLVTTPAELCDDLVHRPVQAVPVPARIGTALGLLWSDVRKEAPRLIPLPLAIDWARKHAEERTAHWKGTELLERALEQMARLLEYEFASRAGSSPL